MIGVMTKPTGKLMVDRRFFNESPDVIIWGDAHGEWVLIPIEVTSNAMASLGIYKKLSTHIDPSVKPMVVICWYQGILLPSKTGEFLFGKCDYKRNDGPHCDSS